MKRTLFSLMLLLGLVFTPTTGAMAQPTATDQTYTSQITGDVIDIGSSDQITWLVDDFDFRETPSFQEEYIWFTYGWSNFQMVLIDGPNDPETYHLTTLGNMEQFYDSWELLGEDIGDDGSWFLGEGEFDGVSLIVFYDFQLDAFGDVDMAFLQFTDASHFQADLEFIQSEVTIGGEPLQLDADVAEIVAETGIGPATSDPSPDAEEGSSRTSRSSRDSTDTTTDEEEAEEDTGRTSRSSRDSTDTTTDEEEDDDDTGRTSRSSRDSTDTTSDEEEAEEGSSRTSRTSRDSTDTTSDDEDEDDNTSETSGSQSDRTSRTGRLDTSPDTNETEDDVDADATSVAGGDWSELGLISDTEWESLNYGTVVTWDSATWEFPTDYEFAIMVNEDPPYDILTLQTVDGLGYVYITIDVPYDSTPRSLIDYWTSDDYAAQISGGINVIETGTTRTSATMVYETVNTVDEPLIVVLEATFLDDGGVVFSQISASPNTIHVVYEQYLEGVEFDGVPLDMTFTVEDIQDISGN